MDAVIPKPVNGTQRKFNELCKLGGGTGGGPARTKVQQILRDSGQALNKIAHHETLQHLNEFKGRNPWHVCFAVGMSWGHLAKLDLRFTAAAINLLSEWNDDGLRVAVKFCVERGPAPVEQSLKGGHTLFKNIPMPGSLPSSSSEYRRLQDRWFRYLNGKERPRYIGLWNATAVFMVALFSNLGLAKDLTAPTVLLPTGGPISAGLSYLHRAHLVSRPPSKSDLDDGNLEMGVLFDDNAGLAEVLKGLAAASMIDIHSGVYMLGTGLADSDNWFPQP